MATKESATRAKARKEKLLARVVLFALLSLAAVVALNSCAVKHGETRMIYCVGACISVETEEYESQLQEVDLKRIAAKRIGKKVN